MRIRFLVGVLALSLATPSGAAAQAPAAAPVIQRTMLVPDSGVLTITGSGLGPDVTVFLEGEMVPVLPGATTSKVQVQAPAALPGGQ